MTYFLWDNEELKVYAIKLNQKNEIQRITDQIDSNPAALAWVVI